MTFRNKDKVLEGMLRKYGIENVSSTTGIQNHGKNELSFFVDLIHLDKLKPNKGTVFLTTHKLYKKIKTIPGNEYRAVDDPVSAFFEFHNHINREFRTLITIEGESPEEGKSCKIDSTSRFGENVKLGDNVIVSPYSVIGPCLIALYQGINLIL